MRMHRNQWGYIFLAVLWVAVAVWQGVEHGRTEDLYRQNMVKRSRDISNSLAVAIRSQGFFGRVPRQLLEATLDELAKSSEIRAVGLADLYGEMVIHAGEPINFDLNQMEKSGERMENGTLTVVNVIELGPRVDAFLTSGTQEMADFMRSGREERRPPPPRDSDQGRGGQPSEERAPRGGPNDRSAPSDLVTSSGEQFRGGGRGDEGERPPRPREGDGRGGRGFRRWPWMPSEADLLRLEGPYNLILALRTDALQADIARDMWLRIALVGLALIALLGIGAAWRAAGRYFDLEVRLARAQEMNMALREMNLAAAGLAHETRNPLNLVRTMAQIITRESPAESEVGQKSKGIIEEVDRVASRLNEFIDFSKPREAKLTPIDLKAVIRDVGSALESDLQDKNISLAIEGPDVTVEADESLLRQALFNLALNASQAAPEGGKVEIATAVSPPKEVWLEVRDNGSGVPPESRIEIFQPYFTTRPDGAGLGLAIVRQIVMAHRWDIECTVNDAGCTVFRIKKMHLV